MYLNVLRGEEEVAISHQHYKKEMKPTVKKKKKECALKPVHVSIEVNKHKKNDLDFFWPASILSGFYSYFHWNDWCYSDISLCISHLLLCSVQKAFVPEEVLVRWHLK